MYSVYFLSIHSEFVTLLLEGKKQWEFRANPNFGKLPHHELIPGDFIFLVSTYEDQQVTPKIECLSEVKNILRGKEMNNFFGDRSSGRWKQAGCNEYSDRNWDFFVNEILDKHSTAIKLETFDLDPSIDISIIRHRYKDTFWRGKGFTPIGDLKRYTINGMDLRSVFQLLVESHQMKSTLGGGR